jgi:trk system potassium uptake protein TrkH
MKVNALRRFLIWYKRFQVSRSPQMNLVWGFFLYTLIGWVLLCLPFLHRAPVSILDNLFISTSAISTTGLVTVSVADNYNLLGQMVIALLFQVGGIGYMTLTTYYLLFTTKTITRWHNKIIGAAFTMPETIKVGDFIRSAIVFTLVMEVLGAICFFIAFTDTGMATGQAIWYSIFHSISAFCTAGFGLFNDSFESYSENGFINTIISVLAISGSLGFIVITDLWYRLSGRTKSISFTTKIVIYGFLVMLTLGTTLLYTTEPLVHATGKGALMKSFFASMTAMTTVGFNTISTGSLRVPLLLLTVFLMYVGASPSGTAGGMKITTLTAMISVLKSRLFGEKQVTFFNRRIPYERLYVATSTFILYTSLIFIFSFLISYFEPFAYERILFEVASALGTVGLSTGITGDLGAAGKLLIIVLMFIGRVGVLTFGFALLERRRTAGRPEDRHVEDDLAV